jgi:hypothetical protein
MTANHTKQDTPRRTRERSRLFACEHESLKRHELGSPVRARTRSRVSTKMLVALPAASRGRRMETQIHPQRAHTKHNRCRHTHNHKRGQTYTQ